MTAGGEIQNNGSPAAAAAALVLVIVHIHYRVLCETATLLVELL